MLRLTRVRVAQMGLLATALVAAGACGSDDDDSGGPRGASGESAAAGEAGATSSSSGGDSSAGGKSPSGDGGTSTPIAGADDGAGGSTVGGGDGRGGHADTAGAGGGATTEPCTPDPTAYDFPGNELDEDCNGEVDDAATCDGALASNATDEIAYAQAIELCQVTTEQAATWGVLSSELSLVDGSGALNTTQRAIRPDFGSGLLPRAGSRFAVLSTGAAAAPTQVNPSYQAFQDGFNNNTTSAFPADWLLKHGNDLPSAPACPSPAGNVANDPAMLTLEVRVPSNAHAFSLKAFFLSSEFPEFVCSPYNDFFVALLDSAYAGDPANPEDKNLATYVSPTDDVYPVGVNLAWGNTGLFTACVDGEIGCGQGAISGTITTCTSTSELVGSGFDGSSAGNCDPTSLVGGGTGWLTLRGNVEPGETATLRLAIWDTSDHLFDSVVLLDAFEWLPDPVVPGAFAD